MTVGDLVLPEPTSVHADQAPILAKRIERWAATTDDIAALEEARAQVAAIEDYLRRRHEAASTEIARADRRLEIRIGELLPPTRPGRRSDLAGAPARSTGLSRTQQSDFRAMAATAHDPDVAEAVNSGTSRAEVLRRAKAAPRTRPAGEIRPGDVVDGRRVAKVERDGDDVVLYDEGGEALVLGVDAEVLATRPRVSKPDLGGGISHPARFSSDLLPLLAAAVPPERYPRVLDPFAGTGRIHELTNATVGVEIEPEWAEMHPDTILGSALDLPFPAETFDAIVTSPTYGNRFADHHDAQDGSLRRSYTHDLGRQLSDGNSGAMQWGPGYQDFHRDAWAEAWLVLRPGGRFVLNIKDHTRDGDRQPVAGWHVTYLITLGFELRWVDQLDTGGLRQGANASARYPEQIFVFDKPAP